MRTVKEINVDIKKLKAELKASYAYERELKAKMAIDYLEANSFKWTGRVWVGGERPVSKPSSKQPQFVKWFGGMYLVDEVDPAGFIACNRVTSAGRRRFTVDSNKQYLPAHECTFAFIDELFIKVVL